MNDVVRAFETMVLHPRDAARIKAPEVAAHIIRQCEGFPAIALPSADKPVAICGIVYQFGVGEAWMVLGEGFETSWRSVLRMHRRVIPDMYKALKLHRLHMRVEAGFSAARRYAEALGFEYEATARRMGASGEDIAFYVWPERKGQ